jgi:hypothetical protein
LNNNYYDSKKQTYKKVEIKDIDKDTFNDNLAKTEIENVKQKLKDLFRFKHVFLYKEMLDIVKYSYSDFQQDLFDEYFLDKALEDMMPKTENDFNNYKDTIYDKYNKPGYIIQRGKYYIFQPFDDNEKIPMFYRINYEIHTENLTPVKNFVEKKYGIIKSTDIKIDKDEKTKTKKEYDFESVMDYYEKRDENFLVGIVSMNTNKLISESDDIFKVRPPLKKTGDKKRGTGIYSLTGAVCATSKDKDTLLKTIKKLKDQVPDMPNQLNTRENMCDYIMRLLLFLEKYSTSKDDNKMTYVMIPSNHKKYPFPYNLEDRIKYTLKRINEIIQREYDHVVKKNKNGSFENITNLPSYTIELKSNKYLVDNKKELEKIGFTLDKNIFSLEMN